jgi:hypothetical protein
MEERFKRYHPDMEASREERCWAARPGSGPKNYGRRTERRSRATRCEGSQPGGPEEKELLSSVAEAFPDWRWDVEEMLAVDDKVITRYVARNAQGRVHGRSSDREGGLAHGH